MVGSGILSSAVITFSKLISGIVVSKFIAINYGAGELGVYSQLYSITWLVVLFSGGGVNNSIIRFVSSVDDLKSKDEYYTSGFFIVLFFSVLTGGGVYLLTPYLKSLFVSFDIELGDVFLFLCLIQVAYALSNFFQYSVITTGRKLSITLIHLFGTFLGIISFLYLGAFERFDYVLIGCLLIPALYIFPGAYFYTKNIGFKIGFCSFNYDKTKEMLKFSFVSFTSVFSIPLLLIYFRSEIVEIYGWEMIGYWQVVTRISDLYFLFITTLMTTIFFPRFSKADNLNMLHEVKACVKILAPVFIFYTLCFLFLGDWIVLILYDKELLPSLEFVPYQVLGDLLKTLSLIIGYVLLSKYKASINVMFQMLLFLTFLLIGLFSVKFGVMGMLYSYIITYFIYSIGLGFYVFKK
ncbi:hypothetical protein [Photobacterium halotolerans]|uniref:hypothetical protein n=1 Tax=Photobacterium halotolerans TaxID=265726 RepID=UPI000400C482|nr:hypothetical protein [Photobacterium halotolerans]